MSFLFGTNVLLTFICPRNALCRTVKKVSGTGQIARCLRGSRGGHEEPDTFEKKDNLYQCTLFLFEIVLCSKGAICIGTKKSGTQNYDSCPESN